MATNAAAELIALIKESIELNKQSIDALQQFTAKELARGLRAYKPEPNKGGRPVKHDDSFEDEFFSQIEKLAEIWGYSGVRWFPTLCRRAIEQYGSTELRRNKARLEAQIKTLSNRRSRWRTKSKQ
jgi:hypothetical protein